MSGRSRTSVRARVRQRDNIIRTLFGVVNFYDFGDVAVLSAVGNSLLVETALACTDFDRTDDIGESLGPIRFHVRKYVE